MPRFQSSLFPVLGLNCPLLWMTILLVGSAFPGILLILIVPLGTQTFRSMGYILLNFLVATDTAV